MPPEAIQTSATADPRGDIYSLGALGYYLLTRSYIFDATSMEEIQEKQMKDAPIPPTQRTTNPISPEMEQLLLRCLEKEMGRRPQSANELRASLLALPAAADWTPEASASWWDAYEANSIATVDGAEIEGATSLPTVNVDLASRME
jgi:serine/threonine-protein kinase